MPPTTANIRYAQRLAAEIREKVQLGTFSMGEYFPVGGDTAAVVTLEEQFSTWMASRRISESTRDRAKSLILFWTRPLGDVPIKTLKYSQILKVIADRPELSGKTINNCVSALRLALALAVKDGLLEANPVAGLEPADYQKPVPDPFTREETDAIIDYFRSTQHAQMANMVQFWFWTGLRTSELFGLQWGDIDQRNGTMLIHAAVVDGKRKNSTKTHSARTVILNSMAKEALQAQRAHTGLAGKDVFQDPRTMLAWADARDFAQTWETAMRRLKMRYRRPYNMRHSYATTMLMAGMTPAFCARQLGHSIEVFLRTYSKWIDGQQDDLEMARLEAGLSRDYPQKSTGTL